MKMLRTVLVIVCATLFAACGGTQSPATGTPVAAVPAVPPTSLDQGPATGTPAPAAPALPPTPSDQGPATGTPPPAAPEVPPAPPDQGPAPGTPPPAVPEAPPTPPDPVRTLSMLGGYYPNWTPSPVRIRDVHPNYNLIYLFHAQPVGGPPGTTGAVYFNLPGDGRGAATNFVSDLQYARTVQGRKVILSAGGAGNGMSFPSRQKSQTFLDSVVAIYQQLGGFDGLDWNTFEADQAPDTGEMIWISLELKRLFPGFMITAPPAPWNTRDIEFCQAMVRAGAMDFAAPQYYDGPGLDVPSYVADNIRQWVSLLGPEHIALGFGVADAVNYMTVDEAVTAWNQVKATYPTIRGAFNWQIHTDEAAGWRFAETLGPLVNP